MSEPIRIDPARCSGCGQCASICTSRVFEAQNPSPPKIRESVANCIGCGHCVAFCPTGAISVGAMSAESLRPADVSKLPTFEQFAELVRQRRSIRKYKKEPVAPEKLERLFELVQMAPTARNLLPLRWTVVNSPERTRRIAEIMIEGMRGNEALQPIIDAWDAGYDGVLRGAPCLIFASTDDQSRWTAYDSTIAAEIVDLAASLVGLGSCWAGFFILSVGLNPALRREIGLAETDQIGAALMLGVPDGEVYTRIPARPKPNIRFLS